MAPRIPPKPTIGPLARRSLLLAALGAGGCSSKTVPPRIGPPPPPRIGPQIIAPTPVEDAGPDATPDAPAPLKVPAPIKSPARIGPPPPPSSSRIRGVVSGENGQVLAHASLRIELASGIRIVSTDDAGRFELDGVVPGDHPAVISVAGRAPLSVVLTSSRPARLTL